jgi:hypothetical protein
MSRLARLDPKPVLGPALVRTQEVEESALDVAELTDNGQF